MGRPPLAGPPRSPAGTDGEAGSKSAAGPGRTLPAPPCGARCLGHPRFPCNLGSGAGAYRTRSPLFVTQDSWPAQSDARGPRDRSFPRGPDRPWPGSGAPSTVAASARPASSAAPHTLGSRPAPSALDGRVPAPPARPPTARGPGSLGGRPRARLPGCSPASRGGGRVT